MKRFAICQRRARFASADNTGQSLDGFVRADTTGKRVDVHNHPALSTSLAFTIEQRHKQCPELFSVYPDGKTDRTAPTTRKSPMKILIATMGLPYSGKTSWAVEKGLPIVSPDAIRLTYHGRRFSAAYEPHVWATARTMVQALFLAGNDAVIFDATNTTLKRRDQLREWGNPAEKPAHLAYRVYFKQFLADGETCERRAREAGDQEILEAIKRMQEQWQPLQPGELCLTNWHESLVCGSPTIHHVFDIPDEEDLDDEYPDDEDMDDDTDLEPHEDEKEADTWLDYVPLQWTRVELGNGCLQYTAYDTHAFEDAHYVISCGLSGIEPSFIAYFPGTATSLPLADRRTSLQEAKQVCEQHNKDAYRRADIDPDAAPEAPQGGNKVVPPPWLNSQSWEELSQAFDDAIRRHLYKPRDTDNNLN